MNGYQPILRDQRKVDNNHLTLLSIFHFVASGLAVLGILFLIAHFCIMSFFFDNPDMWKHQRGGPPPIQIFHALRWIYLLGAFWFVASGVLNLLAGIFLRARWHRFFCMFVAGINCLHIPLGTVLGVFTLIVLLRDSVREMYEGG